MRRPLKPFVTEYKTPNRRPPAGPSDQPASDTERSPPKLFDMRAKPDSEDSYEAAMRAADALFSSPSKPAPVEADEQPAAPAMIWSETEADAAVARNGSNGGGRILRVLDETPPPEYAALEAAHAPKRRGRKPGSKNKPKVAMPAIAPAASETFDDLTGLEEAPKQTSRRARTHAPTFDAASPAPTHLAARAVQTVAALPAGASTPRDDKRFSWVRDKLKPGEEWKRRRLPRVCW